MADVAHLITEPPLAIQVVSGDPEVFYEAPTVRALVGAIWTGQGITSGGLKIEENTPPGWTIKVTAGTAAITDINGRRYFAAVPEQIVNVSTINPNPAAKRTHTVLLAIYDRSVTGAGYGAQIFVKEDVGDASPPVPAGQPAGYLTLGTFTVVGGQSSVLNTHITNTATKATSGSYEPVWGSFMITKPPFNVTDTWVSFSGAAWPPLTVTVPPSGRLAVSVSAYLKNAASDAAGCHLRALFSKATIEGPSASDYLAAFGVAGTAATRRSLWNWAPGTQVLMTPQWFIGAGNATHCDMANARLLVESV